MRLRLVQPAAVELAQRLSMLGIDAVCGPLVEGAFLGLMVAAELDVDFSWPSGKEPGPRLTLSPGLRYEYFGEQHSPSWEQALDANFYYGPGAIRAPISTAIALGCFPPRVPMLGPMARWKTAVCFVSWLALCPDNDISGGRVLWREARKAHNRAGQLIRVAADSLYRSATPLVTQ